MSAIEINFDGLVGPTHNYAGIAEGNLASTRHHGAPSAPRRAALEGIDKIRRLMARGVAQGVLPPPRRPAIAALRALGFGGADRDVLEGASAEDPALFVAACSAASMWTANAATVIAAPDSGDGRVHIVTANRATLLHRSLEAADCHALLAHVFADCDRFAVHPPLQFAPHFADEGAANHLRLCAGHDRAGLNVFVHGPRAEGRFPRRQPRRTGEAIARFAGIDADRCIHVPQSAAAIEAGAFHNDVVAVANEHVLLYHAEAYEPADAAALLEQAHRAVPGFVAVAVEALPLATAVATYLFNAQLVTLPQGGMLLVVPAETTEDAATKAEIARIVAAVPAIADVIAVDLRESMRNGGGPACLRLRVPVDPASAAAIDPRYLLDERRLDTLAAVVERHWPERIGSADLFDPALWRAADEAHAALDVWLANHP